MGRYHQLTQDERVRIETLRDEERSLRYIAKKLGRAPSTLSRELKRNSGAMKYTAAGAQWRSRRRPRGRPRKLLRPPSSEELQGSPEWVALRAGLDNGWSPEQIAGEWRTRHPESQLHHETLYRFIYCAEQRPERLQQYLPQQRQARRKRSTGRGKRPLWDWAKPLSARPPEVAQRLVPGHWEIDLLCFSVNGAVLLHMVERASRFGQLLLLPGKHAMPLVDRLQAHLQRLPGLVKSLTCDRGSEFAELHQLKLDVYACRPYAAWEKGTVEQQNGVLRRYLPRRTDLSTLNQTELHDIRNELNNRPMKCLGFRTPREVLPHRQDCCTSSVNPPLAQTTRESGITTGR